MRLDDERSDLVTPDPPMDIGQVQRHHLVTDQLVDDRFREQHPFGAPIEATQQLGDVLGIEAFGLRCEPAEIGE